MYAFKLGINNNHCDKIYVDKVLNMYYNKRLFKIFDRQYDYDLVIKYDKPSKGIEINPVMSARGGFTASSTYEPTRIINRRYKTLDDVTSEINNIKFYQKQLDKYLKKEEEKFLIYCKSQKKNLKR
jgi:hypothetical protein